jgi:antitoxin VapB
MVDVSLNIKNDEVNRMVRELASLTGESMTQAIAVAVRERLVRVRRGPENDLTERLLAIGKHCASRIPESYRAIDHGDLLYDERGLPR